jgi:hypothetical protein
MQDLFDEIELQRESKNYTPESIAWELLVGEIDKEKQGKLMAFSEDSADNATKHDKLTFEYEILITIFMELLFNISKLNYFSENNDKNEFIPNYKSFNFDPIFEIIDEKMKLLGYKAYVESEDIDDFVSDKDALKHLVDNRYCRIVLRYYDNEDIFDENDVSKDTFYHMKINGLNKKKYKMLLEIYSIIFLNGKVYRINFDQI